MKRMNTLWLIFSALLALPAWAAEPLKRPYQSIPVYSVSPGAAGSISSSTRSQRQDVSPVPGLPGGVSTRSSTVYGSSGVRQAGIRQSVEYPNGMRVPQQSVQDRFARQRDE